MCVNWGLKNGSPFETDLTILMTRAEGPKSHALDAVTGKSAGSFCTSTAEAYRILQSVARTRVRMPENAANSWLSYELIRLIYYRGLGLCGERSGHGIGACPPHGGATSIQPPFQCATQPGGVKYPALSKEQILNPGSPLSTG